MVKDPFSYSARWGSIGLDCSNCSHFEGPSSWPDVQAISSCKFHNKSLNFQLSDKGFKDGEWFCRSFNKGGDANLVSAAELESVRSLLAPGILYKAQGQDKYLLEFSLD